MTTSEGVPIDLLVDIEVICESMADMTFRIRNIDTPGVNVLFEFDPSIRKKIKLMKAQLDELNVKFEEFLNHDGVQFWDA